MISASQSTLAEQAAWGEFHAYYEGATSQTPAMLVGIADIKPGQQNHAPHKHADEEFLYLIDGDGTWTLGDKTMPAHAGDILYQRPGRAARHQEHVRQAVEVAGGEVEEQVAGSSGSSGSIRSRRVERVAIARMPASGTAFQSDSAIQAPADHCAGMKA